MYHEIQFKNYCRCHALNNLVGKNLISFQEFDNYCNEFDKKNRFVDGFSKSKYGYYNYGNTRNIFGYSLEQKDYRIKMIHHKMNEIKNIKGVTSPKSLGFLLFNSSHTYCMRYIHDKKKGYIIDSLQRKIIEVNNFGIFKKKGLGVIEVIEL